MNWNVIVLFAIGTALGAVETDSNPSSPYANYGQAWKAAAEVKKPMLVVLNPAENGAASAISIDNLRKNDKLSPLLDHYVVAVIDTSSDHGRRVLEVFGTPQLPRVVVIDENQKKQIFQTSQPLTDESWSTMLVKYQHGTPEVTPVATPFAPYRPAGDCPNCRRFSASIK